MTRETDMTRGKFEEAIDKVSLDYPFRHIVNYLKDHDAEQRQVIEQLRHEIALLKQDDAERCTLIRDMEEEERKKDVEIDMLREALQLLYDVQNGCPLPKYQKDWDRAMELTQQAIKEVL